MSKDVLKKIETKLTVKLMPGRTTRDVWSDFFEGRIPKELDQRIVETTVKLGDTDVPYEVYKKLSGYGASKELLDSFEVTSVVKYKWIEERLLSDSIYKKVPFHSPDGLYSKIVFMYAGAYKMENTESFNIEINTWAWNSSFTEQRIKDINKDNAKRLRKYLVSLQSVQCVLWGCTYREDDIKQDACKR